MPTPVAAGLAVLLTVITLLVRLAIGDGLDTPALIVFTIPIILSAYWGGLGPGLLATLLSALGAAYFVLPPVFDFHIFSPNQRWQIAVLFFTGALVSFICSLLHRARERAEAAGAQLQASEERLRTVTENLSEGLILADLEGRLLQWNRAGLEMHGFTRRAEGLGSLPDFREVFELTALDGTPVAFEQWPLVRIIRGEQLRKWPVRIRRRDTEWQRVFSYSGAVVRDATGRAVAFVSIEDITVRHQAEEALREARGTLEQRVVERTALLEKANAELERATRHKSDFLTGMSHELRTPLNAILGFTGTLLMKLPGPLNAAQEKQLCTVQTSARHLLSLINDLLDLAKIESGNRVLNPQTLLLQSVVQEVTATLRPLAEKKGLEFAVALPAQEIILRTDRRALSQILLNLAGNAIKFTQRGRVALDFAVRTVEGRRLVELHVTDTGPGIAPEVQAQLFRVFAQGRAPGGEPLEGSGLGLHLSQNLAALLGGHIVIESAPGRGSRFTLCLQDT